MASFGGSGSGPRHGCHGVGTNIPQSTWGLGCGNPLPQVPMIAGDMEHVAEWQVRQVEEEHGNGGSHSHAHLSLSLSRTPSLSPHLTHPATFVFPIPISPSTPISLRPLCCATLSCRLLDRSLKSVNSHKV